MKTRAALFSLAVSSFSFLRLAAADVPPACDNFIDRVTCAQADVGKPCPTGGTCYDVQCAPGAGGANNHLYKCEVCPPLIDGGTCAAQYGAPCADDAGTCRKAPAWCQVNVIGFACLGPNPELPDAGGEVADATPSEPDATPSVPDATADDATTPVVPDAGPQQPDASGGVAGSAGAANNAAPAEDSGGCSVAALDARAARKLALPSFILAASGLALLLDRRRNRRKDP
jgi:hypothetical protein